MQTEASAEATRIYQTFLTFPRQESHTGVGIYFMAHQARAKPRSSKRLPALCPTTSACSIFRNEA
jgi:hypothetical protein